MSFRAGTAALLRRFALLGVTESDTDETQAQKVTLTLAAGCIASLAVIWVGTYWALGLPRSAAIPFAYQVATVVSLVVFARTKSYRFLRGSQAAMMTALPFLLQWSLGGFVASSAVCLWALIAAVGTLFFYTASESFPWFGAFVGLAVASGLIDPLLAQQPAPIPDHVRTAFFVLNIVGVSLVVYAMLQYAVRARDAAFARSEGLLLNVLPRSIAERLKHSPAVIADAYDEVTVLFADIADFTPFAERTEATRVVEMLNEVFSAFDDLAARHGVEKIKTIGDAYMVAAGLPEPRPDHAETMADMALEMRRAFAVTCRPLDASLAIRIGMESGPVVAGVIGRRKFIYDLWGDTVNTASRMESHGIPGEIQVGEAAHRRLRHGYTFESRGEIEIKGKGRRAAYLLTGRRGPG
ncbi:MAG: adenylate/guanylate cyclase domain-containing protein [Chloroflexota bacterium]